jgi:hypothetical protein
MEELFHGTKERAFASHLEHEKLAFLAAQHACMHACMGYLDQQLIHIC